MTEASAELQQTRPDNPLQGMLCPPEGLLARLRYYSRRYGLFHAVCSYAGRHCVGFWKMLGLTVTRPYLNHWLETANPKILNLGGGNVLFDRWLTADVVPRSDVYMDVTKPLPLPNACIDVIYCEEVIEHISRERGDALLRECFRALKPGGWIRLTTPSLDYFALRALESKEHVREINDIFYLHRHRHIYSKAELRAAIEAAFFTKITESSYRDPLSHFGHFDTHPLRVPYAHPEWSQYWEAQKPPIRDES